MYVIKKYLYKILINMFRCFPFLRKKEYKQEEREHLTKTTFDIPNDISYYPIYQENDEYFEDRSSLEDAEEIILDKENDSIYQKINSEPKESSSKIERKKVSFEIHPDLNMLNVYKDYILNEEIYDILEKIEMGKKDNIEPKELGKLYLLSVNIFIKYDLHQIAIEMLDMSNKYLECVKTSSTEELYRNFF